MLDRIEGLEKEYEELSRRAADPSTVSDGRKLREISRRVRKIEPAVEKGRAYRKLVSEIEGAEAIVAEGGDAEMIELAKGELAELLSRREAAEGELEEVLEEALLPEEPFSGKGAVIEIRAGTGGEEACLFAADLYRMYCRYTENRGWRHELLSSNATGRGGMKEVIFTVRSEGAYDRLRWEGGIHRVQRVPATEASGRIHTSAATVAVLPEAEEEDFALSPQDLKIDVYRSSGPGGQSVNTTDSAVRITHIPTGEVVTCQDEKSQHKNKAKALKVLRSRLMQKEAERRGREEADARRSQVRSGDRSEKIRTYNFPQNRVTDHRAGFSVHNLGAIMDGSLDRLLNAVGAHFRKVRMVEARAGGG